MTDSSHISQGISEEERVSKKVFYLTVILVAQGDEVRSNLSLP